MPNYIILPLQSAIVTLSLAEAIGIGPNEVVRDGLSDPGVHRGQVGAAREAPGHHAHKLLTNNQRALKKDKKLNQISDTKSVFPSLLLFKLLYLPPESPWQADSPYLRAQIILLVIEMLAPLMRDWQLELVNTVAKLCLRAGWPARCPK